MFLQVIAEDTIVYCSVVRLDSEERRKLYKTHASGYSKMFYPEREICQTFDLSKNNTVNLDFIDFPVKELNWSYSNTEKRRIDTEANVSLHMGDYYRRDISPEQGKYINHLASHGSLQPEQYFCCFSVNPKAARPCGELIRNDSTLYMTHRLSDDKASHVTINAKGYDNLFMLKYSCDESGFHCRKESVAFCAPNTPPCY